MAVYTPVSDEALSVFLTDYEIGVAIGMSPISEGVENTNYKITTSCGDYILTLFEKRTREEDLPFFMALTTHLAKKGLPVAAPVNRRDGAFIGILCERPAVIIEFLSGRSIEQPTPINANAVGEMLAEMHHHVADFTMARDNPLSLAGFHSLAEACLPRADECAPGLHEFVQSELTFLDEAWPADLPGGVVHTDLFPDNVLFVNDTISGVIDFYFSATDSFAFDLAVTFNAWCFDKHAQFIDENARALADGYLRRRALTESESAAMPVLLRGAALRFLLTRLYDWLHRVDGALVTVKDPLPYRDILQFHRDNFSPALFEKKTTIMDIYTDGACSGNPGPGGWGVLILDGGDRRELCGGERETTNNRMELMAAIEALRATAPSDEINLYTDSQYVKNGINQWIKNWKRNGWKTASKKPVKNQDLWETLDTLIEGRPVHWHWVKGHAGHPGNERADELARQGAEAAQG